MNLTPEEMAELEKMIVRMGKKAREWRWSRWIQLLIAVVNLAMGVWLAGTWMELNTTVPKDPGAAVVQMDLWMSQQSTFVGAGGLFLVGLGASQAGWALGHWRKSDRESLLANVLRCWMEERADCAKGQHA